MGRIDDALRRAGGAMFGESQATRRADGNSFVSPWGLADEPAERNAPRASNPVSVSPSAEIQPRFRMVPRPLLDAFGPEWRERLALSGAAHPMLLDQFRRLAATLVHAQRGEHLKTVMITSAGQDDGKTLTSLNLALVMSGSYKRRVLLIEADLRRPAITLAANLPVSDGLSKALKGNDGPVSLVHLTDRLAVLPAGRPDFDPLSALSSAPMQRLLRDAAEQFDWVIVDTPPLGATADAGLLCPLVDATILVIRAGRTPYQAVQRSIEVLGKHRILGVVLNGVDQGLISSDVYYGYSEMTAGTPSGNALPDGVPQ